MDYLSTILEPIQADFTSFKQHYARLFESTDPQIDCLLKFLLERKGKSMRPILVLLVAGSLGKVRQPVFHLASSVELLHQGSLIHDDIVDESSLRRGKESANSAFGNKIAVLLGDYIVSQSLQEIVKTGHVDCLAQVSELIGTLSQGEILQIGALDSNILSEETYFDIISKKTAYLFSVSARLSAILSGGKAEQIEAFTTFAYNAGLCFQIMDDILDFSQCAKTGKPAGNDLKEGKFTLPSIYALNHSTIDWSGHIAAIRALSASPSMIKEVTDYTVSNGGVEYAVRTMERLKKKAMDSIMDFVSKEFFDAFHAYLELVTDRIS